MKNSKKIIDISLPLSEETIVYPGNPKLLIRKKRSLTSEHSIITIGSHTGTHVDSPRHAYKTGTGVDRIELNNIVGECRVLDCLHVNEAITTEDIKGAKIKKGERILVKTKNSVKGYKKFYDDYIYLDGEAAKFLADKKIKVFGIDYLSVKKRGSTDNQSHTALLKSGVTIFEGLDLRKVEPGKYFFIGLPLKFIGLDGSPARAILLKEN